MADPGYTPAPAAPDLRAFARAVRFRDRAVALAVAQHERAALQPSSHHARATFDAIEQLIREDERARLAATGRLLPADARREIEHNMRFRNGHGRWVVDEGLTSHEPQHDPEWDKRLLGMDCHPVSRTHLWWPDGSDLRGPWLPAPTEGSAP